MHVRIRTMVLVLFSVPVFIAITFTYFHQSARGGIAKKYEPVIVIHDPAVTSASQAISTCVTDALRNNPNVEGYAYDGTATRKKDYILVKLTLHPKYPSRGAEYFTLCGFSYQTASYGQHRS